MRSENFEIKNGILTGYTGEEPFLQIPERVHTIGERAFHNCRALREVTISEDVRTIGSEAFQLCANLTEIHGGEGVTRIERDAFAGTPWYRKYKGNETGWDPSEGNFKMIGRVLVRAKRNIRRAEIPAGTLAIAADAFTDCTLMEEVRIPPSVTYIGWRAFSECMGLIQVRIPGTVKRIGWHAFEKCNRLSHVCLEEGIEIMENGVFSSCRSLPAIRIPASVRRFGGWMFFSCVNLEEVWFDGPVEELPERCFSSCLKLMHVHLAEGLKRIGVEAFYECTVLQEVILPEGLLEIGRLAFGRDRYFETLVLPKSLRKLDESVFHGCAGFTELTLPGFLRELPENTFHGCAGIEELTISEGVQRLGRHGFTGCRRIRELKMPDSMREIDDGCFEGCTGLLKVQLDPGLKRLGRAAFARCVKIEEMELPEGLTEIGDLAFDHCLGLADAEENIIQRGVFYAHIGEKSEFTVPAGCHKVASGAFAGNRRYRRLFLPEEVEDVGVGAFRRCENLEDVRIFSPRVDRLGEDPFDGCRHLICLTACGIAPESFADEEVRMAAALGFGRDYERYSPEIAAQYRAYIARREEKIVKAAIDRQLTDSLRYFSDQRAIGAEVFPRILEYAQQKRRMEIIAVLLEYRKGLDTADAFSQYAL